MANEIRTHASLVNGTISVALASGDTTMSSAALANLGVIDTTNYAAITIENEIIWITAHTAAATTATIVRGQEGTSAAAHNINTAWVHGPTAQDFIRPACRVWRSTQQSINTATATAITFDSENYDTNAMHDLVTNTQRVSFPTPGIYAVTAGVGFVANATGVRVAWLALNGSDAGLNRIVQQGYTSVSASDVADMVLSTQYRFIATDYVELHVYQTSGGALNTATLQVPHITACRIGD